MAQRKRKQGQTRPGVARAVTPPADAAPATAVQVAESPIPDLQTQVTIAPTATATPSRPERPARAKREPVTQAEWLARYAQRAEERNAEARAQLIPLQPGERPWPILAAITLTAIAGLVNFVFWVSGTKIQGKPPSAPEMVVFTAVTASVSVGMWTLWYQAVLAFLALDGILIIFFSLLLIEASNVLGVVVPLVIIVGGGFLFWKLIRVLARLQMPERRARPTAD